MHHFRAKIYAIGINRCVDVPQWVSKALGGQTHIRVTGMVGGEGFRSNLAPRGGGMHRLFVHSGIWRKLGVDMDDVVDVGIERDDEEWEILVPADLAEAMPAGSEGVGGLPRPYCSQPQAVRRPYRGEQDSRYA